MAEATIGRALKRLGVTQREFYKVLSKKYHCSISLSMVGRYCVKTALLDSDTSRTIEKCLREEYGIIYDHGQWVVRK